MTTPSSSTTSCRASLPTMTLFISSSKLVRRLRQSRRSLSGISHQDQWPREQEWTNRPSLESKTSRSPTNNWGILRITLLRKSDNRKIRRARCTPLLTSPAPLGLNMEIQLSTPLRVGALKWRLSMMSRNSPLTTSSKMKALLRTWDFSENVKT